MTHAIQTAIPLSQRQEWRDALTGLDYAFAHTWESCYAMQLTTRWPTFLYVYESSGERVVCPFAERSFGGTADVVTPYGFSGFTGLGDGRAVLEAWHRFARARDYVCGYIGLNPLLGPRWRDHEAEVYNEVFVLDLDQSEQALFSALSANRKRAVNRWRRHGSQLVLDREKLTAWFLSRYHDFMRRRQADSAYSFSRATLEHLLAFDNVIIVGAGEDDDLDAAAVFAYTPSVADYLFGISTPGGEPHTAPLVWAGALELRRRGVPTLNLGGGVRMGDGVADFKRRFGATPVPLRRLRQVYDDDRFEALCRSSGADSRNWSDYFPPYRAGREEH